VINGNHKGFTGEVIFKHLRQNRSVERIDEACVDICGEQLEVTHRCHLSWLINNGLLDGIRADGTSGDVSKRAFAKSLIQASDQIRHSIVWAFPLAIVFNFHDAKDIGIDPRKRSQDLGALAGQFLSGISPAALHVT